MPPAPKVTTGGLPTTFSKCPDVPYRDRPRSISITTFDDAGTPFSVPTLPNQTNSREAIARDAPQVVRRGVSLPEIEPLNEKLPYLPVLGGREASCTAPVDAHAAAGASVATVDTTAAASAIPSATAAAQGRCRPGALIVRTERPDTSAGFTRVRVLLRIAPI